MAATCRQLAGRSPPSQLHTGRSPRPGANAPDGTILLFTPQTHHRQEIGHFLPHKHTVRKKLDTFFYPPPNRHQLARNWKDLVWRDDKDTTTRGRHLDTEMTQRQEEDKRERNIEQAPILTYTYIQWLLRRKSWWPLEWISFAHLDFTLWQNYASSPLCEWYTHLNLPLWHLPPIPQWADRASQHILCDIRGWGLGGDDDDCHCNWWWCWWWRWLW